MAKTYGAAEALCGVGKGTGGWDCYSTVRESFSLPVQVKSIQRQSDAKSLGVARTDEQRHPFCFPPFPVPFPSHCLESDNLELL